MDSTFIESKNDHNGIHDFPVSKLFFPGEGVTQTTAKALADHYERLESGFEVRSNDDYRHLVVPNGNSTEAIHRWFHLKEAFSGELLRRVLKDLEDLNTANFRILDPFSGAGTTAASVLSLTAARELRRPTVYGIETNPFLHLVSSAKLRSHTESRPAVLDLARRVAAEALADKEEYEPPALTTFHDERYFDPRQLQPLLRIRQSIDERVKSDGSSLASDLLRVALGATIEAVANLRRDGRALRYTPKTLTTHPVDRFLEKCEQIEDDLPRARLPVRGRIVLGDGVTMNRLDRRVASFDLVLFSPPYPNNIDYTEVYKLENWFLGFLSDAAEFRQQRLATVHSHPSVSRPNRLTGSRLTAPETRFLGDLLAPVIEALPADRYQRGRQEMIEGYVVDMYRTLRSARSRLKPGAPLVYVVGNSAHGRGDSQFVIAADLLIAASASLAGLEVERVEVARNLHRRSCNSPYLRESVVFARRPRQDQDAIEGTR